MSVSKATVILKCSQIIEDPVTGGRVVFELPQPLTSVVQPDAPQFHYVEVLLDSRSNNFLGRFPGTRELRASTFFRVTVEELTAEEKSEYDPPVEE